MNTNTRTLFVVIFLGTTIFFQQCSCNKTGLDCAQVKYSFDLPVKAYPDKDSISINDTIWLEINESAYFKDKGSGQVIDYSGAENLGTALAFGEYNKDLESWTNESPSSFDLILKEDVGKLVNQTSIDVEYIFSENNKRYKFLLGVVPKKKGLFSLLFSNSNNTYRKADKCTKASFDIYFANTNQHYPLNPFYIPGTNPLGGDYYFVVK
jgi:hypothetical protein